MTHPSIARARALVDRLKDKEVLYGAERALREPDEPDALEAWRPPPPVALTNLIFALASAICRCIFEISPLEKDRGHWTAAFLVESV